MTTNLWFLNTLVTIRVPHGEGADGVSVLESRARHGDSAPMHVHGEDEIFHVLEGELDLKVGDAMLHASSGQTLLAPKDVAHTYRVTSTEARWLVITAKGDFERMVRAFGRPAPDAELPAPAGPPDEQQAAALAAECRRHGIELVGPPLH